MKNTTLKINGYPYNPSMPFHELVETSPAPPNQKVLAVSLLVENISQEKLAEILGITTASLSRAKNGQNGLGKSIRGRIEARYNLAGCIFTAPTREPDIPQSETSIAQSQLAVGA